MTDDERADNLHKVLYDFLRYRDGVSRGALSEGHLSRMGGVPDAVLDDVLASIEWGIRQSDFDYWKYAPTLPEDRATVVTWLEIALRDLRALRARRGESRS